MPSPSQTFSARAETAIAALRTALASALLSAGVNPSGGLQDQLGVDKKLAWKLSRLLNDADPISGGRYLPGEQGLGIALRAAGERGADPALIERVRERYAAMRGLMVEHAGTRERFLDLLHGLASERDTPSI